MDCGSVREKLIDLVYGELSPAEDRALRDHCARCAECGRELAELQGTLELTRRVPEPELPPFLNTRVIAHVREQAEMKRKPSRLFAWARLQRVTMTVVGLLVSSVIVIVLLERNPTERPGETLKWKSAESSPSAMPPGTYYNMTADGVAPAAGSTAPAMVPPAESGSPAMMPPVASAEPPPPVAANAAPTPALVERHERMREAPAPRPEAPAGAGAAGPEGFAADAMSTPDVDRSVSGGVAAPADEQLAAVQNAPAPAAPPKPAAQPAPAPTTVAPSPAPASAPSRAPGGLFQFKAKADETRRAGANLAVGGAAPAPAPAPAKPEAAPAPAPASNAPAPPPAVSTGEAKGVAREEESATAPAQPPSPAQLVTAAAALEKDGKWSEALAAYQRAASALGYSTAKDAKPPACSPTLKAALEGMARCQGRLGKKTDADATAAAQKAVCK